MSLNSVREVNRKAKNISDKRICVSYSGSDNVSTTHPEAGQYTRVGYVVDTPAGLQITAGLRAPACGPGGTLGAQASAWWPRAQRVGVGGARRVGGTAPRPP